MVKDVALIFDERLGLAVGARWAVDNLPVGAPLRNDVRVAVDWDRNAANFDDFEWLPVLPVFGFGREVFHAETVPSNQQQSLNTNKIWWRRGELNPRP